MFESDSFIRASEEVFHSSKPRLLLSLHDLAQLKAYASQTPRGRARICSHKSSDDTVQEMFIVHPRNAYVRPHKHLNKIESMLVLQGEADFVTFDEEGAVQNVVSMGDLASGRPFYNSMRTAQYHSLVIRSEWLVFLEVTMGPFKKEDSVFAPWSPDPLELNEVNVFLTRLEREITK